jgi:phage terminase large subunit
MSRWFVGLDYGTTNPFHAVLIGLGVDESLYVVSEWRWDSKKQGKQKTDAAYSRDLRRWLENQNIDPDYVCVDPSAASFIQQLYYDHVRGVTKADNKVIDGIRLTGSLFSQKKLFINESCKHLIDELLSYCWDTTASNAGKDQPVKFNDHGADALRYGLKTTEAIWSSIVRS